MASSQDRSHLIYYTERPDEKLLFHCGEQFLWESLPVGTRVIYPPEPFPALPNLGQAIEDAVENPLDDDPLSAQLRPGMKLTIAFDDLSLPLPPVHTANDPRKWIIEKVLAKCAEKGVDDIHLIAALGVHRRMKPREIWERVGARVYDAYTPGRIYNHDPEDPQGMVLLGETDQGEEVWINRRVAESDLLIYVNINLTSMDGGHKSINTGLTGYRTLQHHHNVHTLLNCHSLMDPPQSHLHSVLERMGRVVAQHVKSFHIETTLNTATFPRMFSFLEKRERTWSTLDQAWAQTNRISLNAMPFPLRLKIWQSQRAPYGVTSVQAGQLDAVHARTLQNIYDQQLVPVKGASDVVICGTPYLCPYNVNSILNPILTWVLTLGYCFHMYRGHPLVKKGGVLIFTHPLYNRFDLEQHPSYRDFYEQVLPQTKDPAEMEAKFEQQFALNERYRRLFREGYAYHGVHPFYMYYWGLHGKTWPGKVIFVPGDPAVAERMGVDAAPNLTRALEMAKDMVGPDPSLTYYHWPPIFICDVEEPKD